MKHLPTFEDHGVRCDWLLLTQEGALLLKTEDSIEGRGQGVHQERNNLYFLQKTISYLNDKRWRGALLSNFNH